MRVIKIGATWCSACLIMNKVWNNILKIYNIETLSLDYDIDYDEVQKYSPGDILPVFIFLDDEVEIKRIVGEINEKEFSQQVEKILNEKNN